MEKKEKLITKVINGTVFSLPPSVWDSIPEIVENNVFSWISSQRNRLSFDEYQSLRSEAMILIGNVRKI